MNCKYHNNLKGTNTCSVCGEWICENCVLEIDGRIYCKDCLKVKLKNEKTMPTSHTSYSSGYIPKTIRKSGFLTFILSFILPGTPQMYLGYTRRGLFILAVWMLGAYIDAFSPLILLTYVFGLFDAFKLKNNLERGIYQEDGVGDVKKFISENKFFIAVLSLLVFIPMIFDFFEDIIEDFFDMPRHILHRYNIHGHDIENIVKLVIIIILILLIATFLKSKKHNKKDIDKIDIKDKEQ